MVALGVSSGIQIHMHMHMGVAVPLFVTVWPPKPTSDQSWSAPSNKNIIQITITIKCNKINYPSATLTRWVF